MESKQETRRVFSACFLSRSSSLMKGIVCGTAAYKTGHNRSGQLKPHLWASPNPSSNGPGGLWGTQQARPETVSVSIRGPLSTHFQPRLGTLCSRFACGNCLEEDLWLFVPMLPWCQVAVSPPPGVMSGPSGLQVGRSCLVGWALRWGLRWCSFWHWAPPLCVRLPVWLDAGTGRCKWGDMSLGSLTSAGLTLITFCFVH